MDTPFPLLLASRSPRRAELLTAAGYAFQAGPFPDVDERPPPGLTPPEIVVALARRKAEATGHRPRSALVLAADTLVFLGLVALGKPTGPANARAMLARLSGTTHEVATGVALAGPDGAGGVRTETGCAVTAIRFRRLGADEIAAYVASGEPLGKAGAYALQGGAGAFVERIQGPRDNVIGLPMEVVAALVDRFRS